jgi:hypothetical protein
VITQPADQRIGGDESCLGGPGGFELVSQDRQAVVKDVPSVLVEHGGEHADVAGCRRPAALTRRGFSPGLGWHGTSSAAVAHRIRD